MASAQLCIERALAPQAEAVQSGAFLIGGYAGQPSFGHYLQLEATVRLHEEIGAHQTLYVLLDSRSRAAHARSNIALGAGRCRVLPLFYHPAGAEPAPGGSDGLVPLPHVPSWALVHVYGGGFLADRWGHPVRNAVAALMERHALDNIDGQLRLFISGLQVSPSAEAEAWRPLFARAEYVGARDPETVTLLKGLLNGEAEKVQYSGDDALLAVAGALKNGAGTEPALAIAAHVRLTGGSPGDPELRLERVAGVIAAAARHFGAGVACDLLVACPDGHWSEEEAVERLQACYGRLTAAGAAPPLTFRVRNIFAEAVDGTFRFGASFLVTCSYQLALTGLLCHCPTLLIVEDAYYRQKAAGLADAFKTQDFAAVGKEDDAADVVGRLLEEKTNRPPGNGSYSMWTGQADKALRLARVCLDMDRAAARRRLELTAGAFREVAADLGELRKRRIQEERLAKEAAEQTALTISIPASTGLTKYLAKSYWSRRRRSWAKSIRKRANHWS
jgi:hypothetical protein